MLHHNLHTQTGLNVFADLRPPNKKCMIEKGGMVECLLERAAVGKLRMVDAQSIALTNAMQSNPPKCVVDMSTCGTSGTNSKNVERDLMHKYGRLFDVVAESYTILMDLQKNGDKYTFPVEVPFIVPTDLAAAIYDGGYIRLAKSILGEGYPENAMTYWDNALQCAWGQKHPDLQDTNPEVSMVCPLSLSLSLSIYIRIPGHGGW